MSRARWIILLRHAHADSAVGEQADLERALSVLGEAEAEAAGAFLAEMDGWLRPTRVLSSPALRTRQTVERVLGRLGFIDTRYEASIYEASPADLLDVLEAHQDAQSVLLVGHNPGLEWLVALLCTGRSSAHRGMPPGGVAVLRLAHDAALEPGSAELVTFWSP